MLYYKTRNIITVADELVTIKEANEDYQALIISNNSDVDVEIHFANDENNYPANTGIILQNQTLVFERHDLPKNKVVAISSGVARITINWSE